MTKTAETVRTAPSEPSRSDGRLVALLTPLAVLVGAATIFYSFIHPLTQLPMEKHAAALIPQSPVWSWIAGLPLPIPHALGTQALALFLAASAGFGAYAAAVSLCWNRRATRRTMRVAIVGAVVFHALSALAFPHVTGDMLHYILTGRIVAVHHQDAFVLATNDFPDDPFYPYTQGSYTEKPQNKGAGWVAIIAGGAAIAGDDPATAVLVFRLGLTALSLASLAMIIALLRRLAPGHVLAGAVLFGWNPLVIVHGPDKADTAMVFVLLAGVTLLMQGRRHLGVVGIALSAFVKLLTLPMVAVYAVRELAARRWRELVVSGVAVTAALLALYLPFTRDPALFASHIEMASRAGAVMPSIVGSALRGTGVALVIAAGVYASRGDLELLRGWAAVVLFLATFLFPPSFGWYLILPVALGALAAQRELAIGAIALSSVGLFADRWARSDAPGYRLTPYDFVTPAGRILGILAVAALAYAFVQLRARRAAVIR